MLTHGIQDGSVLDDLTETGSSVPVTTQEDSPDPENHSQDPLLRTITSFISAIQKHLHVGFPTGKQEADIASGLVSTRHQEPLRALTALATLLVRDTEVTAMAIKWANLLALIACTSERGSQLSDLDDGTGPLFLLGRNFVATRNPRNQNDQANNDHIDVALLQEGIDVTLLQEEIDAADPLDYLHRHWHRQTFEQHAGQITYFINQCCQDPQKVTAARVTAIREGFILYVVGQSSPKMWRRINPNPNPRIPGRPSYFQQIIAVDTPSLLYRCCDLFNKFDTTFLHAFHSHRGQSLRKNIAKDLALRLASDSDDEKSYILGQILQRGINTPEDLFQNLLKLDPDTPQSIYMRETYCEFHELLRLLLVGYKDSVKKLWLMKKDKTSRPSPAILLVSINTICDYMSILHPLAYSAAIVKHFQMLAMVIQDLSLDNSAIADDNPPEDSETEAEEIEIEEEDSADDTELIEDDWVELPFTMSEQYKRWLQLQMTYLDTVSLIITLVGKMPGEKTVPITLTIYPVPRTSPEMCPWDEVLRNVVGVADDGLRTASSEVPGYDQDAEQVLEAIYTMMDRYPEFKGALTNISSKGFKGRIHCEAFLAGVIANRHPSAADSRRAVSMIGVSKRCCPACSVLLRVLSATDMTTPFRILGSHRMVTPWSLPPSLPDIVVKEVVKALERELREVLTKIIVKMRLEDQKRRRSSASSSGVSADSHPFTQDDKPERVSMLMDELQLINKYVHNSISPPSGVVGDVE